MACWLTCTPSGVGFGHVPYWLVGSRVVHPVSSGLLVTMECMVSSAAREGGGGLLPARAIALP